MRFAAAIIVALFAATAQAQLVSPAKERELRALFPTVSDSTLERAFAESFLYTLDEIEPAYQRNGRFIRVAREAVDGDFHFPWAHEAGMDHVEGASSVRFVNLPRQPSGERWPIVYTVGRQNGVDRWTFPVGTVVGELLLQEGPDGKRYPFLIRVLTRERDDWDGEQFVPYPTAQSLADGIMAASTHPVPEQRLSAVASLLSPDVSGIARVQDKNPVRLIDVRTGIYQLPKLDPSLVSALLTEATFEPLSGGYFKASPKQSAVMPSNEKGSFNIVPPGFRGNVSGNTREGCRTCHATFGTDQGRFNGSWIGSTFRGGDRIASFRPGTSDRDGRFVPRRELLEAGLIAEFDKSVHPSSIYTSLK